MTPMHTTKFTSNDAATSVRLFATAAAAVAQALPEPMPTSKTDRILWLMLCDVEIETPFTTLGSMQPSGMYEREAIARCVHLLLSWGHVSLMFHFQQPPRRERRSPRCRGNLRSRA